MALTDIPAARLAVLQFMALLPEEVDGIRDTLLEQAAHVSPVDQICGLGEAIYALRDEASEPARRLAIDLIAFASANAWHGLLSDQRGLRMTAALHRSLGDEAPEDGWPAPNTDPAARPDFAKPAPVRLPTI